MISPIENDPRLQLVVVMIIIPVTLNALMFWVIDSFIKLKKTKEVENVNELKEIGNYYSSING